VGVWSGGKPLVVGALGESMTGVPATVDMHHIAGNFVIVAQILEQAVAPDTAATPEPVLHAHTGERDVWEDSTYWDPSWTWYAGGIRSNQADLQKFLVALGKGTLVTKADHDMQLAKVANSGSPDSYFALGVPVVNGWIFTNPSLEGYSGALGYLPAKDLTVVVYTTRTQETDPNTATATEILTGITKVISPDRPVVPPG
jgi:CubicO group peptidase (beta-lactamase class C family)